MGSVSGNQTHLQKQFWFLEKQWVEPFGDMRQELVFIGQNLDQSRMTKALDECLLSEEELLRGRVYWETLSDPFPQWEEA